MNEYVEDQPVSFWISLACWRMIVVNNPTPLKNPNTWKTKMKNIDLYDILYSNFWNFMKKILYSDVFSRMRKKFRTFFGIKIYINYSLQTLIAPSIPPYMAPATAGVQASCPAIYRFLISVSGRITHLELSLFENSKLHLVPYDPPWKDWRKLASETGVPHSYHNTFPFTCGTWVREK